MVYTSVVGTGVVGDALAWGIGRPVRLLFNVLAFFSYLALSGRGGSSGDGIIPVETATLKV